HIHGRGELHESGLGAARHPHGRWRHTHVHRCDALLPGDRPDDHDREARGRAGRHPGLADTDRARETGMGALARPAVALCGCCDPAHPDRLRTVPAGLRDPPGLTGLPALLATRSARAAPVRAARARTAVSLRHTLCTCRPLDRTISRPTSGSKPGIPGQGMKRPILSTVRAVGTATLLLAMAACTDPSGEPSPHIEA